MLNTTHAKAAIIGAKTTIVLNILKNRGVIPSYLPTLNKERNFNFLFYKLKILFQLFKLK